MNLKKFFKRDSPVSFGPNAPESKHVIARGSERVGYEDLFTDDDLLILIQEAIKTGDLTDQNGNPIVSGGGGGGGSTNLAYVPSPSQGIVTSDTGTDAVIPASDGTNAGLLLPSEKNKLSNITATTPINLDNIKQLTGVADAANLGTFSGTIISDNTTIKNALQELETAVQSGSAFSFTSQLVTIGNFVTRIDKFGTGTVTVNNTAAGVYEFVIPAGTYVNHIQVSADNTTLNANQEMNIVINNTANSFPRRFILQLYDKANNALVDQQITGTVHLQTTSSNTVTFMVPGLNGFGSFGYIIELS